MSQTYTVSIGPKVPNTPVQVLTRELSNVENYLTFEVKRKEAAEAEIVRLTALKKDYEKAIKLVG